MPRLPLLIFVALVAVVVIVESGLFDSGGEGPASAVGPAAGSTTAPAKAADDGEETGAEVETTMPSATGEDASVGRTSLSPAAALGQMVAARFAGREPSAGFLDRIRAGEIGGVILFKENLKGEEAAIRGRSTACSGRHGRVTTLRCW
ncbi:MAG: hypothetical protein ACOYD4_15010 [Solirubrobacterales bacterium]